uniref:Ig-like domain-containing protein n=1 Tax=Leptobrachium leishanense TaxID=445787 RepID=A0A8C5QN68_9ANUR
MKFKLVGHNRFVIYLLLSHLTCISITSVPPEVKVSSRQSGSTMKLHCQVYGFYPRDVDVIWKMNRMEISLDEAKHILPNSDGTYQLRVSVEVIPEEEASYSCHVDHSSLGEPLITMLAPAPSCG